MYRVALEVKEAFYGLLNYSISELIVADRKLRSGRLNDPMNTYFARLEVA